MTLDEAIERLEFLTAGDVTNARDLAILAIARAVKALQPCEHEWSLHDDVCIRCGEFR